MPYHFFLPLCAAIIFALSSMTAKRAFAGGVQTEPFFHHANYVGAGIFSTLLFANSEPIAWHLLYQPAIVALAIFIGSWFTFGAIRMGDVSLVTPLLGVKVVVVAIAAVWIAGQSLSWQIWLAAVLASTGIFALGFKDIRRGSSVLPAIGLALLSAISFGVSDVLLQKWAGAFGEFAFLAVVALLVACYSAVQAIVLRSPLPRFPASMGKWVWLSNVLLAAQGMMMALALAFFDSATQVNIVYGSRGLWGIFLVWAIGSRFGLDEGKGRSATMAWRLIGALFVTAAIILAVAEGKAGAS